MGLSEVEAAQRLLAVGPNEVPAGRRRSLVRIVSETLREPMFLLLLGAAVLYLVIGDIGEGLFLVCGALAAIGLVIFQEARSERALQALRELAQPSARVLRAGVERQVPARELVPGDVLLVGEGERLVADGALIAGDVLSVDESTLTGESSPVPKQPAPTAEITDDALPGAELGPWVFAGSLIVRGQGVVLVGRTGSRSALGRIGDSLASIEQPPTPLQAASKRLIALLGSLAVVFSAVVALAYGLLRDDWIGGALAGVTVGISLIPEEFPMVLAVFLALGAWRLATHKVLVRRGAVVEALGAATVLCVDKTGTLTENRMRVARVWTPEGDVDLREGRSAEGEAAETLRFAVLASAVRPVDPMDKAVHALTWAAKDFEGPEEPERAWPLHPERLAVVQMWRLADGGRLAAAKGAPEAIFKLCRIPDGEQARLHAVVHDYAERGLRVLGVAATKNVEAAGDEPAEMAFEFSGLIGFVDPLREDVPAALAEARAAGISVIMVTGDHPSTALAIARAAGIDTRAGVLLGSDLKELSFPELCESLKRVRVFARIAHGQKLQIVEALKADGEIVAMTGDGVNDAPALEAAHIGVAMGKRGTDVAREAADLVLLDDSFASIVGGIRLGRRIFANLRRALIYITAVHVPIAGVALAPILLGLPPLLFPMHVVLLELVIDPTCSLVFEAEPSEARAMTSPPRPAGEALFGRAQIVSALVQGVVVLAAVMGVYLWALGSAPEAQARAAAFVVLVVGNLVLALADSASSARVFAPHRRIYWAIVLTVALVLAVVLNLGPAATLFRVAMPEGAMMAAAVACGVVAGGWMAAVLAVRGVLRRTGSD